MAKRKGLWIEIYKDGNAEFRWRAKVSNARIIADAGEGYRRKAGLMKGLHLLFGNWMPEIVDLTSKPR